jgi:hypothetical protein
MYMGCINERGVVSSWMILLFLHNAAPNFHHKTHHRAAAVSLKITPLLHTLAHTERERERASQITTALLWPQFGQTSGPCASEFAFWVDNVFHQRQRRWFYNSVLLQGGFLNPQFSLSLTRCIILLTNFNSRFIKLKEIDFSHDYGDLNSKF